MHDNREKAELLNEYFGSVLQLIIVLLIKLDNNSDIIIIAVATIILYV